MGGRRKQAWLICGSCLKGGLAYRWVFVSGQGKWREYILIGIGLVLMGSLTWRGKRILVLYC